MRLHTFACCALAAAVAAAGELTLEIPLDASSIELVDQGCFTGVFAPGAGLIETEGAPRLPVVPVRIAMPTGTRAVSLEVLGAEYQALPGIHRIQPAGRLYPLSLCELALPAPPDPHIYGSDSAYPAQACRLNGSSAIWGIPVAQAWVFPVRWDPAGLELSVLRSLTVRVMYEDDPSVRLVSRRTAWSESESMDLARSLVVNPEGVSPSGAELVGARDLAYGQYVIICSEEYQAAAQELADWKTAKGIPATVHTVGTIQGMYSCWDMQQELRAFLTDCRDEGADYVLIMGDDDRVEARDAILSAYGYEEYAPCDLYFADNNDTEPGADRWDVNGNHVWGETTDDIDWHPDLWVGRASVNTAAEAAIFVGKVLVYESAPSALDYFETAPEAMRVGYSTGVLWYSPYYSGATSGDIIASYAPSGDWEHEMCYEENGNSGAITTAMIDAGPHHVYHASHGSQTFMYTSYGSNYTVDMIMGQTNISSGGLPAIWNSIACDIGQIDGYECCGDAWIGSPQGGGFGAFNSRFGWGHYGAPGYGPSERICERFYYEHWQNDIHPLGQAHLVSMDHFAPPSAHADSFDVDVLDWCLKEYNLLGDPEIDMWTSDPVALDVDVPASIPGTCGVTVTVSSGGSPLQGALVCLQKGDWQTGEVYATGTTDAAGQATLWVEPATTGQMTATVTCHDHIPWQGSITVSSVGLEGPQGGPAASSLGSVHPCPATTSAVIPFSLAGPCAVRIEIFDLAGRIVAVPLDGERPAGSGSVVWDAGEAPSGIYLVRMSADGFEAAAGIAVIRP